MAALAAFTAASPPRQPAASPRVVSLHDVTSEIVVALDAVDHLVGRGGAVDLPADVLAALAAVPEVSGIESIVAARPDVVFGLGVVAEQSPDLVRALRQRGIDVVLYDPATAADVLAMTADVAGRLGVPDRGADLVAALGEELDRATAAPGTRRVFVYDCCDPPFTAGGATVLTDVIRRAGGENIFADVPADWTHVSWEQAVARSPDLVVVVAYDLHGQRGVAGKRARLARVPGLADVPVVDIPLRLVLGGIASTDGVRRLRDAIEAGAP